MRDFRNFDPMNRLGEFLGISLAVAEREMARPLLGVLRKAK